MAYLGIDPKVAYSSYRNIDDISASFDGFVTTFPLTVNGVAPTILPINEQQLLINIGGVPQQPDPSGANGFRLVAGNIVFSSAPSIGETFWGVILASANYISASTRFADGSAGLPSVTFASDVTTGIYSPGAGQLAISTGGTGKLFVNTSGIQVPGDVQANSYNGGPLAGFRNVIINGNPTINQRGYVSGTATSGANQYTLDRWRVVTSGQNISFTDSANVRTVTAPAGGCEQVVEGLSILSGTYTLNWTGTATATVGGTAVAKGGNVTLTGGTDATVKFSSGTFTQVQLEPGAVATPFERRPIGTELALCQRYYSIQITTARTGSTGAGWVMETPIYFPVSMRAVPTIAGPTGASNVNLFSAAPSVNSTTHARFIIVAAGAGDAYSINGTVQMSAEL